MAKKLTNARFFLEDEIFDWVITTKYADSFEEVLDNGFNGDFEYDEIEQPFHHTVDSDDASLEVKVYLQKESGFDISDPFAEITLNKKEHTANISSEKDIDKDLIEQIGNQCNGHALILCKYFEEQPDLEKYSDMDTDSEGVLITLNENEDELVFQKVSGKERPDLSCFDILGNQKSGRPYSDEDNEPMRPIWDAMGQLFGLGGGGISFGGETSLEEKIELAEDGDTGAMNELAMLYLNGNSETEADPEKAVYWFEKLAELDDATAQYNLGLHYAKGHGVARDFAKAAYWMQRAADNGDEDALPLIEKFSKAAEALKKVDSGDPQAQTDLGDALMFIARSLSQGGDGEEDMKLGFDLLTKASAQGIGHALWLLGLSYQHGRGTEQDMQKALETYGKGAELGHAPCIYMLAYFCLTDENADEERKKKGFALCKEAAEKGYGAAMQSLGRCYEDGDGCEQNWEESIKWYKKAYEELHDESLLEHIEMMEGFNAFWAENGERLMSEPLDLSGIFDDEDEDEDEDDDDDDDEDDNLSLDEEFEAFWKENGERLSGSDPFGE